MKIILDDAMQKYREYLSRESKYAHIKTPMTYQDWYANYIEINTHFSNAIN